MLWHALMLGLCTAQLYDPARPVLWTQAASRGGSSSSIRRGSTRERAIRFRAILAELIDENPFAIRAVLRILGVEFTADVPTLAVTCEERPRLLVNLDFVGEHCRTDAEVKALLCHEFLHVLLRHTEERKPFTRARHLALDAVINAIIHREHGSEYSAMMSRYYADAPGLGKLLRPMNEQESAHFAGRAAPEDPVAGLGERLGRRSTRERCSPTTSRRWPRRSGREAARRAAGCARRAGAVHAATGRRRLRPAARQPRRPGRPPARRAAAMRSTGPCAR